jgi:hypothetical protein
MVNKEPKGPIYDNYEDIMHRHYKENYDSGRYPFERYEIAYTYGFGLVEPGAYRDRDWLEIEDDVRAEWEEKEAGPWEDFKGAIKHAWETAKDAVSD